MATRTRKPRAAQPKLIPDPDRLSTADEDALDAAWSGISEADIEREARHLKPFHPPHTPSQTQSHHPHHSGTRERA